MKVLFNEADRIAIVLQGKETDAVEELTGLPVAHMREGDAYEIRMPQEHVIEDNIPAIVDRLEVLAQKLEEKKGREEEPTEARYEVVDERPVKLLRSILEDSPRKTFDGGVRVDDPPEFGDTKVIAPGTYRLLGNDILYQIRYLLEEYEEADSDEPR